MLHKLTDKKEVRIVQQTLKSQKQTNLGVTILSRIKLKREEIQKKIL